MPDWHSTWKRMRHLDEVRDYMTLAELRQRLAEMGVWMERHQIRQAIVGHVPEKSYGVSKYTEQHLRLAADYAKRKGLFHEGSRDGSVR
jgi:hypothetical protein